MTERLDSTGYYALGIPAYLALMLVEHLRARARGARGYRCAVTLGTLSAGLGEVVIGLFLGPVLLSLYDRALARFALVEWPQGSWAPWALALFLGDLCYYWYHRAGHAVACLWAVHGVHHQVDDFDLTISLRHPWFSDFYSWPFYAPLPLLGVPPLHFFIAISAISFYAVTVHSPMMRRPGLWLLVTPDTHVVHHAWNAPYLHRNFGAMFTLWDRLFGTHVEGVDPARPPLLGIRTGYETHDGALAQFVMLARLLSLARAAPTRREALRVLLGRPGTLPLGVARPPPAPPPREDAAIPAGLRLYAVLQFGAVLALSTYVLWLRAEHPAWLLLASAAVILASLASLGGLLDGRRGCVEDEALRLGASAVLGAGYVLAWERPAVGACVIAAALAGGAALAAMRGAFAIEAPEAGAPASAL